MAFLSFTHRTTINDSHCHAALRSKRDEKEKGERRKEELFLWKQLSSPFSFLLFIS